MAAQGTEGSAGGNGAEGPFKAWHFWAIMGGLFSVVFVVNAFFVVAALNSWTGVVEDNAYERGVAYNDQLAAAADQRSLGWQTDLSLSGSSAEAQITLTLVDADDKPLEGAQITVTVRRPTQATLDQTVSLEPASAGQYQATVSLPAPGVWELRAEIVRDGQTLEVRERTILP